MHITYVLKQRVVEYTASNLFFNCCVMAKNPFVRGISKLFSFGSSALAANSIDTACFSFVNLVPSGKKRSYNFKNINHFIDDDLNPL